MGLDRQGCVDRQHFKEEGQLASEGVFDFGSQAAWELSNPLAQGGLACTDVLDLSIGFRVGPHPQLDARSQMMFKMSQVNSCLVFCLSEHALQVNHIR